MAKNTWISGFLSAFLAVGAVAQEKPSSETPVDKIINLQINGQAPRIRGLAGAQPTVSDVGDCQDYLRNVAQDIQKQTGPYAAYAKKDGSEQTVSADCYNKDTFVQSITYEVRGNEIVLKTSTTPPKASPSEGRGGGRSGTRSGARSGTRGQAPTTGENPPNPVNE